MRLPWDRQWVIWMVQNILVVTLCDGFKKGLQVFWQASMHSWEFMSPHFQSWQVFCGAFVLQHSTNASLIHRFVLYIGPLGFLLFPSQLPFYSLCCCSVAQSCPALCDTMDCSTPGFPVLHCLPEFAQTHVHWVIDAIQPSHPLALSLSWHQGPFRSVSSSI